VRNVENACLALVLSDARCEAGDIDVEFVDRHLAEMSELNLDGRVAAARVDA
jgi:hypothetical protein